MSGVMYVLAKRRSKRIAGLAGVALTLAVSAVPAQAAPSSHANWHAFAAPTGPSIHANWHATPTRGHKVG